MERKAKRGWKDGDMIKKELLLNSIRVYKNRYPIYDQNGGKMAKVDTLFMTKTAEKPYPLGPHIPIYTITKSMHAF